MFTADGQLDPPQLDQQRDEINGKRPGGPTTHPNPLKGGNELGFSAHISAHIFYESEVDLLGRASVGGGWWGRYNKYGYRAPRRIVWPGGVCILVLAWTYGA
jgi:hypothetical protein